MADTMVFPEGTIRVDRAGDFFYGDERVEHPRVLRMLKIGLVQLEPGVYGFRLGPRTVTVEVEDAPWQVEKVLTTDAGPVARLSNETEHAIAAGAVVYRGDVPYLTLPDGEARFQPLAALRLGDWLIERDGAIVLRIGDEDRVVGEL